MFPPLWGVISLMDGIIGQLDTLECLSSAFISRLQQRVGVATTLDTGHRRWKLWNAPLALSCRLTPPCFEALLDNFGHLAHFAPGHIHNTWIFKSLTRC